ncbi:hypothetical protein CDL15_Pgr000144 [Punica granatum]|uniref:Lipoyl synthase N-terminal domain-containing protein n=1 Tax=Punica granatum TaxID=22663 RepID=A0A218Y270_PUNGR|nr:hypothetical protein CDL15_Pgr000144 [Punica granatum]
MAAPTKIKCHPPLPFALNQSESLSLSLSYLNVEEIRERRTEPPSSPQALGSQLTQTLEGLRARLAEESPTLSDFISRQSTNSHSVEVETKKKPLPKPKWMKESIPGDEEYVQIKRKVRELKLHTACEEAKRKTHLPVMAWRRGEMLCFWPWLARIFRVGKIS